MFINNSTTNLLKFLSGEGQSTLPAQFLNNLHLGMFLQGNVLKVLSPSRALVQLLGQRVLVETEKPVVPGQKLSARVEQLSPTPALKLIDETDSFNSQRNSKSQPVLDSRRPSNPDFTTRISHPTSSDDHRLTSKDLQRMNLQPGQEVTARVSRAGPDKSVHVQINGHDIRVEGAPNRVTQPGDSLTLKVHDNGEHFTLVPARNSQAGATDKVDNAMIKPYLPFQRPSGEMTALLEHQVLNSSLLQDLRIDPSLVERFRLTLQILQSGQPEIADVNLLRRQLDLSGIRYEAKIKNAVDTRKLLPELPGELTGDLKGQVMDLARRIEKALNGRGYETPVVRHAMEVLTMLRAAADNIELQQLTHYMARQENNPVLIQLPNPFGQGDRTVRIYLKDQAEGDGKAGKNGKKGFVLVFLLEFTALGNMRVDTHLQGDQVTINIDVTDEAVSDFINEKTPELVSSLKSLGFNAVVNCCVKDPVNFKGENNFWELPVDNSSRLVDLQT